MGLISLLFNQPITFLALVVPLIYSIIAHEVSHGWVAYLFGDDTAQRSGRLSLNPLSHLEPLGTLMLFVVGFGWAKPVPINYMKLKNVRAGFILVSLAGCAANIFIATVAIFLLHSQIVGAHRFMTLTLLVFARINIMLGAFNLIPIPPLDGARILMGLLPARAQRIFSLLEPYGFYILIMLLLTRTLNPVIYFIEKAIVFVIGALVGYTG